MILTRISCGRMSISVAHLSFSQTWAPTWSHPNHYFVWTFIHQSMRFHKSYKSRYRLSASHSCAVFRVRVSSVPLIKRYFGLIKKWSIDNSLGEDGKASGSFYSFHGYRWTRNISIFSSTFFFVLIRFRLLKEMLGKGLLCGYTIVGSDEIVSPFLLFFLFIFYTLSCYTTCRWLLLLLYIFTNISDSLTIPFTDSSRSLFRKPIYNQLK